MPVIHAIVSASAASTRPRVSRRRRSRKGTNTGVAVGGRVIAMPVTANAATAATKTKVIRHPSVEPIHVPAGTPITSATLRPPVTVASARPRWAGSPVVAATAPAVGVYAAAETA